jgi:DNA-binding NarL/FixJ family response regulator
VPHIVFVGTDLMFSSQLLGAAGQLGQKLAIAAHAADAAAKLAPDTKLVIVDLTLPGLDLAAMVAATRATAPAAKIVAFGPHVDEAALAAAGAAGADLVLSRGQFHKQYAAILRDGGAAPS